MITYEVNLVINSDIYEEYMTWLSTHVKEMLSFPGFLAAKSLLESQEDESSKKVTILYTVDTMQNLQNYFDQYATAMRVDGLQRFPGQFTANRRIFEGLKLPQQPR